jgi:hypothetical protein
MIMGELQSSSYQTVLVTEQVIGTLASLEKSKERKYTSLSQYFNAKIEDTYLAMRILIDVVKQT